MYRLRFREIPSWITNKTFEIGGGVQGVLFRNAYFELFKNKKQKSGRLSPAASVIRMRANAVRNSSVRHVTNPFSGDNAKRIPQTTSSSSLIDSDYPKNSSLSERAAARRDNSAARTHERGRDIPTLRVYA